jgi:hypothetical protein
MQSIKDSERQRGGAANVSMINTVKNVHLAFVICHLSFVICKLRGFPADGK